MGGFRTLCSLLPASSSCRSLVFSSSLVRCLICSWRSADSCSLSSFMAEILDFSSRTTRSVSYRKRAKTKKQVVRFKSSKNVMLQKRWLSSFGRLPPIGHTNKYHDDLTMWLSFFLNIGILYLDFVAGILLSVTQLSGFVSTGLSLAGKLEKETANKSW